MSRFAAFAFLALTVPAAAVPASQAERDAIAVCIRNLSADALLAKGAEKCVPPHLREENQIPSPGRNHHAAAMEVVRLRAHMIACPKVVAGPKAGGPWRGLMATYNPAYDPADVPALKAWIAQRTDKYLKEMPTPAGGWCASAKHWYGRAGMGRPHAIAMRDGSDSTPRCIYEGTCGAAVE